MIVLLIIFLISGFVEVKQLINKKFWHELKVSSIFLSIALIFLLLYIFNLPLPNPVRLMEYEVKDLLHLNYK
ncbi:MAG: hypothetical protein WCQ54_06925 [Clostridiaceae bacterium]